MIPVQQPGQSFDAHQREVAAWLGTDVATMNRDHDRLHAALCRWLGTESLALKIARGEAIPLEQHRLANLKEDAVLYLQRFIVHARTGVPSC